MSLLDDLIPQLGTLEEYLGQPLLLVFISTELQSQIRSQVILFDLY